MPISRKVLTDYLDELLGTNQFKDYGPNGLQVEGDSDIKNIVFGVTVCQELILEAIEHKADAIIVHHGLFWQGEPQVVTGIKKNRLKLLLDNDINLWGYHLPLDCHLTLGNNAQIGQLLPVVEVKSHNIGGVKDLLWTARLSEPKTVRQVEQLMSEIFGQEPLYLGNNDNALISCIAWCSGGAQKYITDAKALGADLYFSGEVSEQTMHLAKELEIHYLACGHHATERFGIKALALNIESQFDVNCKYLDVYNPV